MCGKCKCLKEDECIKEMKYTHMMKYYLTLKLNAILIQAIKWMNHENTCWSRLSQRPNKNVAWFDFYEIYIMFVFVFFFGKKESQLSGGEDRVIISRWEVSVWNNDNVLEMDCVMVAQKCEYV